MLLQCADLRLRLRCRGTQHAGLDHASRHEHFACQRNARARNERSAILYERHEPFVRQTVKHFPDRGTAYACQFTIPFLSPAAVPVLTDVPARPSECGHRSRRSYLWWTTPRSGGSTDQLGKPVFEPKALDDSPRIGHIHVTVDDAPWHWADASGEPLIIVGLPVGANTLQKCSCALRSRPQKISLAYRAPNRSEQILCVIQ